MNFTDLVQTQEPGNAVDILSPEYNLTKSRIDEAKSLLGNNEPVSLEDFTTAFDRDLLDLIDSVPLE